MTDLEICNRALAHLGDFKIDDLTAPTLAADTRAEVVNRFLPIAKREVLSTMDWAFALADSELVATTTPTLKWTYAHTLETDTHRIVGVYGAAETSPDPEAWIKLEFFELAPGIIKTHSEFVSVQYVSDADFAYWPYKAQAACARLLAHYIAVPIKGDMALAQNLLTIYKREELPAAQYEAKTQHASNENYDSTALITRSDLYRQRVQGVTSLESE